jgi:hypothetical protein
MNRFRYGAVWFTLEEIEHTGFRHGQDLIAYYPPSQWGTTPSWQPGPDEAYRRGYARGLSVSYKGDQSHLLPK